MSKRTLLIRSIFVLPVVIFASSCAAPKALQVSQAKLGANAATFKIELTAKFAEQMSKAMDASVTVRLFDESTGCPDIMSQKTKAPNLLGEAVLTKNQLVQEGKIPAGKNLYFLISYKESNVGHGSICSNGGRFNPREDGKYVVQFFASGNFGEKRCVTNVVEVTGSGEKKKVQDLVFAELQSSESFWQQYDFGRNLCK